MIKHFLLAVLWVLAGSISSVAAVGLSLVAGESVELNLSGVSGDFVARVETLAPVEGISRYTVRFASPVTTAFPQNNEVIGEMYLPAEGGITSDPVILLHILNGNFELERLIALELARAGAPAFWFKLPFYGERRPETVSSSRPVSAPQLLQLLDQGSQDFQRAADFMGTWQEEGDGKVNAVGISMGGILAYYFASQEPRVGKIVSVMAGGDLWGIIQQARETRHMRAAFLEMSEEERTELIRELELRDPLHVAPLLRERMGSDNILMINASLDEVIPRIHAEKLAAALGIQDEVYWVEDVGHYSIAAKLGEVIGAMVRFLTNGSVEMRPVETKLAQMMDGDAVLTGFLSDLGSMLDPTSVPLAGQKLETSFTWVANSGDNVEGSFSWLRSPVGHYKLAVGAPGLGEIELGRGDRPWLFLPQQNTLLLGNDPGPEDSPLLMAGGRLMLNMQLLANMLQYGVRVPGLLDEMGRLEAESEAGVMRLTYRARRPAMTLVLDFNMDRGEYTYCEVRLREGTLKLDITHLDIATTLGNDDFNPPGAGDTMTVNAKHLQHAVALLLEAMGNKTKVWR